MRRTRLHWLAIGIAFAAATTARAFTPGSLLVVEPLVGVREWAPGAATSPVVIPSAFARAVAIDAAGNAIVADPYGGTIRYSPSGALLGTVGMGATDVAVGPSGAIYVVKAFTDEVWRLAPPVLVANGLSEVRGLAATRDAAGNDVVLVTSSANGGELLRVLPGPTAVLASGLGATVAAPQLDRLGNLLVPSDGQFVALDPLTGATRGTFPSALFVTPTDVTATSGDRYFVAASELDSECKLLEKDPIFGFTISWTVPSCASRPNAVVAVPGGTPAPKLATGDLLLSDRGAFGGAGALMQLDPSTGAPRLLATIGDVHVKIGPTLEPIAVDSAGVSRFAASTGKAKRVLSIPLDLLVSAAFEKTSDLAVIVWSGSPRLERLDRASGVLTTVATFDQAWLDQWQDDLCFFDNCPTFPVAIAVARRALPGSWLAGRAPLSILYRGGVSFTPLVELAPGAPVVEPPFLSGASQDGQLAVRSDGSLAWLVGGGNKLYKHGGGGGGAALVSSGGLFVSIAGIDVEDSGNVVVANRSVLNGVIRVNAVTGAQSPVGHLVR